VSVKISQLSAASSIARANQIELNQGGTSARGTILQALQCSDKPAFLAYNSVADTDVTGDGTQYNLVCDSEVFDNGGDYDNTTGIFTAPVTGKYLLTFICLFFGMTSSHNDHRWGISTTARSYVANDAFGAGANPFTQRAICMTAVADMDAGQSALCFVDIGGGTKVVDVDATPQTYFAGVLVG
jgi:hypothetical protein